MEALSRVADPIPPEYITIGGWILNSDAPQRHYGHIVAARALAKLRDGIVYRLHQRRGPGLLPRAHGRYQSLLAELFARFRACLGYAVGINHQIVADAQFSFGLGAGPLRESAQHGRG